MKTSMADGAAPSRNGEVALRLSVRRLLYAAGAVLLLCAAACQFAIGPATSPGFTYLAVIIALWGLGTLLAAGLAE